MSKVINYPVCVEMDSKVKIGGFVGAGYRVSVS